LAQCHTLLEIEELAGQATTAELSKQLELDKSTLSRTIHGLVEGLLVRRIPHPTDRRFTLLALTDQGQNVCDRINRSNDRYFRGVFEGIAVERRAEVIDCFELLVSALQGYRKGVGKPGTCHSRVNTTHLNREEKDV